MYFTLLSITSISINAILLVYLLKKIKSYKELEIKLKITRDYANQHAEIALKKARTTPSHKSTDDLTLDNATTTPPIKKNSRRGRKNKQTVTQ